MKKNEIFLDLQLFADGAAAAGTSAGGTDGTAASSGTVATGDDGSAAQAEGATQETREEAFKRFRTEYKSEIDKEFQGLLGKRLKSSNDFKNKMSPLMESLAAKYGCAVKDVDAILKAVDADTSYYEQAAYDAGMSVESYKSYQRMKRENEAFNEAANAQKEEAEMQKQYTLWMQQAEVAKQAYPDFNFENEVKNLDFSRLIKAGVDLKTAYSVVHSDELINSAKNQAAQEAAAKLANSVATSQSRPNENGLGGNSPAKTKVDINNLTAKDIAEYKRKAARGEVITFTN